ncbi:MAG TPA: hypothetical protein VHW04_07225, partial [Solirubrobacteraceae bacterium]|nr:hypothetical protein [Solirubrobacteraceae bacterium]
RRRRGPRDPEADSSRRVIASQSERQKARPSDDESELKAIEAPLLSRDSDRAVRRLIDRPLLWQCICHRQRRSGDPSGRAPRSARSGCVASTALDACDESKAGPEWPADPPFWIQMGMRKRRGRGRE